MKQIDSTKNATVKLIKQLTKRKKREKEQLFVIEGRHLVEEALVYGNLITDIFVIADELLPPEEKRKNIPVTIVTEAVMKDMSQTVTPPGIIALCQMIPDEAVEPEENEMYVLVDNVQDPGNLGTIIRTADAVGAKAVILGEGTVDVYNDKVIRSTQGSFFHVPVLQGDLEDWIKRCRDNSIPVFGTSLQGGTTHTAIEPQPGFALIIGNEGAGVNEKLLEKTDQNIYVPIYGKAESLNVSVATGILLYYLHKVN